MRHILAECLVRRELHDPRLDDRNITIGEVRVSRDLKAATVFASELGVRLSDDAAAGLGRAAAWLGGRLAREMHLKYAPRLTFVADETYDHAARMERLLDEARRSDAPAGSEDGAG